VRIRLAYGKTGLEIDLPDGLNVTVIEPTYAPGLPDPIGAVRAALRQPIGLPPLRTLAKTSDKVGIVFSDITRPTPNSLLLPAVLGELDHLPGDQIVLFNATGTHRSNTQAELVGMLGDEIVKRYRIVQNDAQDRDSHILVGRTGTGNDIWLHREFVGCEVRICTGFIEPHFFAGFSGGGKAIMPGLALLETIMCNHGAKNLDNPLAGWGITRGNPVWEEIRETAQMVHPLFLLNVTLNRDKQITGVFAGEIEQAHAQGCAFAKEKAMVLVQEPFDIVITTNSGYPLDLNLYQAVKGMSAAAQIVRPGGDIIIAAECWDGIPSHGEYKRLLWETDSPQALLDKVMAPGFCCHDQWEAQIHAQILLKAKVHVYADGLSDEELRRALVIPCRSIEGRVAELRGRNPQATVAVLPEGPQTVPQLG
jgi:nickel-dependent lactate racemase